AVLARQQCGPELEATIFAMDLRTYGKGHHRYRVRAEQEHGVRIVRCRPHEVVALADGSLRVRFADPATGELGQQTFDLVVLSTGQAAPRPDAALAALLGAGEPTGAGTGEPQVEQLAPAPPPLVPGVASPRPGIFVCGSCHGLSDIAEAVAGGSAAAGRAARWLAALGWKVPAPAPAVAAAQPAGGQGELRVDVLLCRHPTAPGTAEGAGAGPAAAPAEGEPPLEQLRRDLAAQPGAGTVRLVELPRDAAGWQELEALLRLSRSERVLFGACPQHVHDRQLLGLARRAGVDPLLVRVVALEDAPAVQRGLPDEGARTRRALLRLRAALADLRRAELPPVEPRPVEQRALVVGGGVTGMHAALSLAERGIAVVLVERAEGLGGRALCQRLRTLDGQDGAALAAAAIDAVARQRQITVHCGAQVVESSGFPGNFRTVIHTAGGGRLPVAHGVTILATGGTEAVTTLYGRGAHDAVLTQPELAARLADGSLARGGPRTVVMIQCVGSRQPDGLDYCSRVCCHQALASALALRRADPAGRVLILAREVMAYGPWEQYYGEARRQGVLFARHAADDP
ncbi:MAG: hypothetical protein FJ125_16405, partial [Deltaproteobacteria bacterium]|nr:hypothetical protein [Deltaproteobacteria bacterium]